MRLVHLHLFIYELKACFFLHSTLGTQPHQLDGINADGSVGSSDEFLPHDNYTNPLDAGSMSQGLIENLLEELDSPEEWFYSKKEGACIRLALVHGVALFQERRCVHSSLIGAWSGSIPRKKVRAFASHWCMEWFYSKKEARCVHSSLIGAWSGSTPRKKVRAFASHWCMEWLYSKKEGACIRLSLVCGVSGGRLALVPRKYSSLLCGPVYACRASYMRLRTES
jgi:hypothetical protein